MQREEGKQAQKGHQIQVQSITKTDQGGLKIRPHTALAIHPYWLKRVLLDMVGDFHWDGTLMISISPNPMSFQI